MHNQAEHANSYVDVITAMEKQEQEESKERARDS